MMLILTQNVPDNPKVEINFQLSLTAEQRTKSRQRLAVKSGEVIHLKLPRGTVLHQGDLLSDEDGKIIVEITAKPEPVITVKAENYLTLLKAAYHLGNRHIPLEINPHYLRFSPDPVLVSMLKQLGLELIEEIAPFAPETGAYHPEH
jgi:urease accessory protein